MKCVLRLFEVRRGQSLFELSQNHTLVGRDAEKCDVVLDPLDTLASRTHFSVECRGQLYLLTDLSKNGTWVNNEKVGQSARRLYHGDVIEAGNAEVVFLLAEETETAEQLFEDGKSNELLEPSYAIQCYSLAHRQCPTRVEYASRLLNLLEREGRTEEMITGGAHFDPGVMMRLADDVRVAEPIANAFVKIGDFARALEVIEQAGGESADRRLGAIVANVRRQTGDETLLTITERRAGIPLFTRGKLTIYIEDREDFVDLRYVERYYTYLQQCIDPLFGGPPGCDVAFHVTVRDHLFAQSLPNQTMILGYYSRDSRRIFVRPRRWMVGKAQDQDFHIVLMHEYVHLQVHHMCSGIWLPMWYDEGLAHLLSGSMRPEDCRMLRSAKDRCKSLLVFSDAVFSPAHGDLRMAHLQSYAVLLYLARIFNKERVMAVISGMEEHGGNFQRSFESIMGMSLRELDDRWWSALDGV